MEPVGELDEDDPDVLGHRQEHLADVLGLLLLVAVGAELRQLGDAVDEVGDLGAEALLDVGQAVLGVLGDVVEERRLDRDRVDAELGEDLGRRDRVGDVRLAGGAALAGVGLDREVERARRPVEVGARVVLGDRWRAQERRSREARSRSGSPAGVARLVGGRGAGAAAGPAASRARPLRRRLAVAASDVAVLRCKDSSVARSGRRVAHGGEQRSLSRTRAPRGRPRPRLVRPTGRPVGADDRRSWPLPASRTTSPGRARSKRGLDGRAAVGDEQQVVAAPLAGGLGAARDLVEDRLPVLAARILVRHDDEPGSARRRCGPSAAAWPCRARRRTRTPRSARRRGPRRRARGGRAPPGATPGCGRSRR